VRWGRRPWRGSPFLLSCETVRGLCVSDRKPQGQGKDDDKVAQATSADLVGLSGNACFGLYEAEELRYFGLRKAQSLQVSL
jgi:hypothetical protein